MFILDAVGRKITRIARIIMVIAGASLMGASPPGSTAQTNRPEADKRDLRMTTMERITCGQKAGLTEIAAQRKSRIKELLRLATKWDTQIDPLLLSLEALGKLRAPEAAADLVPLLGRKPSPLDRSAVNPLRLPYHRFPKVLEDTVVEVNPFDAVVEDYVLCYLRKAVSVRLDNNACGNGT